MRNRVFTAAVILIVLLALVSCGSMEKSDESSEAYYGSAESNNLYQTADRANDYDYEMGGLRNEYQEQKSDMERKIIKTSNVNMSAGDFDAAVDAMKTLVTSVDGYVESFDFNMTSGKNREYKNGTIVLKIPSGQYEYVSAELGGIGKISSLNERESDESEQYYDMQSRMNVKKAEEERLLSMIENAVNIEDLILLEERLSNVRAEIESYQSRLLSIDRLVEYSTIIVYLTEQPPEEIMSIPGDLIGRMSESFKSSVNWLISAFEAIVVFLAGALLPLLIIAVLSSVGYVVYRKKRKVK